MIIVCNYIVCGLKVVLIKCGVDLLFVCECNVCWIVLWFY